MRVTGIVIHVLPRVVGVVRALDVLDDLLGPVFHDNVASGPGSEVTVMDDVDSPDRMIASEGGDPVMKSESHRNTSSSGRKKREVLE